MITLAVNLLNNLQHNSIIISETQTYFAIFQLDSSPQNQKEVFFLTLLLLSIHLDYFSKPQCLFPENMTWLLM